MARIQDSEHWPLIETQQWDVLEALLTDFAFLEAKVAGGLVFALVEDFAAARSTPPAPAPEWVVSAGGARTTHSGARAADRHLFHFALESEPRTK
jgi:hypothetical protein